MRGALQITNALLALKDLVVFFLLRLQKIDRKKQVKYFIILSTYYFKSTKICVCINDSETKTKQPSFL